MTDQNVTEQKQVKSWLQFERKYTRKVLRRLFEKAQKIERTKEVNIPLVKIRSYPFDLELPTDYEQWDLYFFRERLPEDTFDLFATYLVKEILSSESQVTHLRIVQIDPNQPHDPDERALYYELGLSSKILMCPGVAEEGLDPSEDIMYALFMTLSTLFGHKISRDYVAAQQIRRLEKTLRVNSSLIARGIIYD